MIKLLNFASRGNVFQFDLYPVDFVSLGEITADWINVALSSIDISININQFSIAIRRTSYISNYELLNSTSDIGLSDLLPLIWTVYIPDCPHKDSFPLGAEIETFALPSPTHDLFAEPSCLDLIMMGHALLDTDQCSQLLGDIRRKLDTWTDNLSIDIESLNFSPPFPGGYFDTRPEEARRANELRQRSLQLFEKSYTREQRFGQLPYRLIRLITRGRSEAELIPLARRFAPLLLQFGLIPTIHGR